MFVLEGVKWQVLFVNPRDSRLRRENGTLTLGTCNNHTKTICIANNLSEYMVDKVLVHELAHAYYFTYGTIVDERLEEIIADFIASYGRDLFAVADDILMRMLRVA